MSEIEEITAGLRHAMHIVKKRGKRDAEQMVKEFNVMCTDPSESNILTYVSHRATNSRSSENVGKRWVSGLREIIAKLDSMQDQTPAWKAELFDDLVEYLVRGDYARYHKEVALLDTLARRARLSSKQVQNFSTSANPGLVTRDGTRKPVRDEGFRW